MTHRNNLATETAGIELLAARAGISDLVYRYAQNIRAGTPAKCGVLFTDDASFEVREMIPGNQESLKSRSKVTGREAILQYIGASGGGVCPLIHNLLIDVQGTTAVSSCVMTTAVWATGKSLIGEYQDSYRYDLDWRFTSRIFTILGGL